MRRTTLCAIALLAAAIQMLVIWWNEGTREAEGESRGLKPLERIQMTVTVGAFGGILLWLIIGP